MEAVRDIEFTQIASDWNSAPLGREKEPLLLLMRNGLTAEQSKERGELRVTRIETISDGLIDEAKVRLVSGLSPEQVEKYRIRKGDILFSHINSDPHLGKTAIARGDYADLLHGMNLLLLRVNGKVLNPQFLHFVCCYYRMKGVFVKICSRSVNQSSINQAKLKALEVPLPSLPEQRKIAGVLGVVQRAIEQQERLLQLTAELKKTLLHQLFTQGLRGEPQKQTEIGPVPESWEVVKIGDVAKLQSGGTPARDASEYWQGGTIPWVKTGEIDYCVIWGTGERITPAGMANSAAKLFPKGTLLMAMYGQGVTRGRVAILGIEAATNQACAAITPRDEARVSSRFLYYFLEYQYENLRKLGHGANQRNMNAALIRGFPVAFPTPVDQDKIMSALSAVDAKSAIHQRKRASFTDLFRTLLHRLMTAQIRVHDLDLPVLD